VDIIGPDSTDLPILSRVLAAKSRTAVRCGYILPAWMIGVSHHLYFLKDICISYIEIIELVLLIYILNQKLKVKLFE